MKRTWIWAWMAMLGLLLVACAGGSDDDDMTSADDDTDDPTDDDTDDTADDDSAPVNQGLLGRVGTGTVLVGSYEGSEDLFFTRDHGQGEDICRIRYSLTSIALRDDCDDCVWAFDLQLGPAELVAEADPGCLATVGVDGSTLAGLEGTVVSYGYNPDYVGHIRVLYVEQGGEWGSVGHAEWESSSGAFSYEWEDGYYPY